MNKKIKDYTAYVLSILMILTVWIFISKITGSSLIMPEPKLVFKEIIKFLGTLSFWKSFMYTFFRCIVSFFITIIAGFLVGILCGYFAFAKRFFAFPIAIIRSTPVIAFILIAIFWFKSGNVPIFVSVLMALPIMITSVSTGIENTDEKLLLMAHTYSFTKMQTFRYVTFPCLTPFLMDGCISTFGLTWKVVAAGEVLCLPKYAAGTLLQKAQVHLETEKVMAITIILVIVSFILEKLMALLLRRKRHA